MAASVGSQLLGVLEERFAIIPGNGLGDPNPSLLSCLRITDHHLPPHLHPLLLGRRQLQKAHFVSGMSKQIKSSLPASGGQKVRDNKHDPPHSSHLHKGTSGSLKVCLSLDFNRRQMPVDLQGSRFVSRGAHRVTKPGREGIDMDTIKAGQRDVGQRGDHLAGEVRFARRTRSWTSGHGATGVDEDMEVQFVFLLGEPHHQSIEAAVEVPIDVAKVVTRAVGSVVGKVHPAAQAGTALKRSGATAEGPTRAKPQHLQLSQELRAQRVCLLRQTFAPWDSGGGRGAGESGGQRLKNRVHHSIWVQALGLALEVENQPVSEGRLGNDLQVIERGVLPTLQ